MGEAIYIPAMSMKNSWLNNLTYKDIELKWFGKNSIFNYPYGLESAFYGMNHDDFRERIKFPKDALLLGDSGGFEIASFRAKGKKINIDPIKILRWQEKNCDIGFNIDVPPTISSTSSKDLDNDSFFDDCLKKTIDNMTLFEQKRENYDMKLYNVLHGRNYEKMKIWYEAVKHFKFEGWGLGGAYASNSVDIIYGALAILYLHSKGELKDKGIHFFGASGLRAMAVLSYISHKLDIRITYDSSSFKIGSTNRYYTVQRGVNLSFSSDIEKRSKIKSLPCDCPVCRLVDLEFLHSKDNDATVAELLDMHNMYWLIQQGRKYNSVSKDKEALLTLIRRDVSSKTKFNEIIRTIKFIDYSLENGLEQGIKKFNLDAENSDKNKKASKVQGTLFKSMSEVK